MSSSWRWSWWWSWQVHRWAEEVRLGWAAEPLWRPPASARCTATRSHPLFSANDGGNFNSSNWFLTGCIITRAVRPVSGRTLKRVDLVSIWSRVPILVPHGNRQKWDNQENNSIDRQRQQGLQTQMWQSFSQLGHMVLMVIVRKHREAWHGEGEKCHVRTWFTIRWAAGNEATVDSGHHPSNDSHAPLEKRDHQPSLHLRRLPFEKLQSFSAISNLDLSVLKAGWALLGPWSPWFKVCFWRGLLALALALIDVPVLQVCLWTGLSSSSEISKRSADGYDGRAKFSSPRFLYW